GTARNSANLRHGPDGTYFITYRLSNSATRRRKSTTFGFAVPYIQARSHLGSPRCLRARAGGFVNKTYFNFGKRSLLPLAMLALAVPAAAQYSFSECSDLQPTDFERTELFSRNGSAGSTTVPDLSEPVAMAFSAVKSGDSVVGADIYFVQRKGSFRKYDFTTKTVKEIGFINTAETVEGGNGDNGLMGVALDPDFQ